LQKTKFLALKKMQQQNPANYSRHKLIGLILPSYDSPFVVFFVKLKRENCGTGDNKIQIRTEQAHVESDKPTFKAILALLKQCIQPNQIDHIELPKESPGCFQIHIPAPCNKCSGGGQNGIEKLENKGLLQNITVEQRIFESVRVLEILKDFFRSLLVSNYIALADIIRKLGGKRITPIQR